MTDPFAFHSQQAYVFVVCRSLIKDGHHILYDCGKGRGLVQGLWLCPRGGFKKPANTLAGRVLDIKIRRARTLVEQSYGLMKKKWKIFRLWKRSHDKLYPAWAVCSALSNIYTALGHPFRRVCEPMCKMCNPSI
jgi:hypothetical protein